MAHSRTLFLLIAIAFPFSSNAADDLEPSGISGALVICGGGQIPDKVFERFRELAGADEARLVVIPTAGARADSAEADALLKPWRERGFAHAQLLHTRDRQQANDDRFVECLRNATAVWFSGGQQSRLSDAYAGTNVEQELSRLLARGGVIGGTSAGAAIQSKVMIASGNPVPRIMSGLDLLPGSIIDQHFRQRDRQPRLKRAVEDHAGLVGFGIDEATAIVVTGRKIEILGLAAVTVCLAASADRPAGELVFEDGDVADLTALRRAALQRSAGPFPPAEPMKPVVSSGSLVIAGGGRLPEVIIQRFLELAGGPDATIVILPTASPDPLPDETGDVRMFRKAGATNLQLLRQRRREEVEHDDYLSILRNARGVWFSGGRQWRFVDAYADTKAYQELHQVLARGGVIGGSSAGASIQAEYLARGNPLGNRDIMSEGYERGFGFLPGVAIDQHFAQRNRLDDMTELKTRYPQLLGIGVDEKTALVVTRATAEVIGENDVYFYGTNKNDADEPRFVSVPSGGRFDLVQETIIDSDVEDTSECCVSVPTAFDRVPD